MSSHEPLALPPQYHELQGLLRNYLKAELQGEAYPHLKYTRPSSACINHPFIFPHIIVRGPLITGRGHSLDIGDHELIYVLHCDLSEGYAGGVALNETRGEGKTLLRPVVGLGLQARAQLMQNPEFKLSDYFIRRQQWLLPLLRTGEYEAFAAKMCVMLEAAATELPLFPVGANGELEARVLQLTAVLRKEMIAQDAARAPDSERGELLESLAVHSV